MFAKISKFELSSEKKYEISNFIFLHFMIVYSRTNPNV